MVPPPSFLGDALERLIEYRLRVEQFAQMHTGSERAKKKFPVFSMIPMANVEEQLDFLIAHRCDGNSLLPFKLESLEHAGNRIAGNKLLADRILPRQSTAVPLPLLRGRLHPATNPATNLARCFECRKNFNPIDMVTRPCSLRFGILEISFDFLYSIK